jgi:hypothetical protein
MVMKDAVDTLLKLIDIERLGDRVFTSLTLMRQCDLLLRLARIILRLMQFRYERYILFVFNQFDF